MSLLQILNTGMQHLPLELVQEIVSFATVSTREGVPTYDKNHLSSLRLVCKCFKFAADPLLFSEINFDFHDDYLSKVIGYFQTLSKKTHPACRYAKTLRIKSFPDHPFCFPHEYHSLSAWISKAIQALVNVRAVYWTITGRRYDILWSINEGLFTLPNLEELHLEFYELRILQWQAPDMIPLRRFRNLRSIDIKGHNLSAECAADFVVQLRAILKSGGSINRIGLSLPSWYGVSEDDLHILHKVLQNTPPKSNLPLQHLRLQGYTLKLDSVTLPHLRHLTSLDVSQAIGMHIGDARLNYQHLWDDLKSASIYIKDLRVSEIGRDLLGYLKAYSGLQKLTVIGEPLFRIGHMDDMGYAIAAEEARQISHELYSSVLPRHKESLVAFMGLNYVEWLTPSYLTADEMASLSVCKKLHSVAISLQTSEIIDDKYVNIKNIIETALMLPEITYIRLSYSRKRVKSRHYACCINRRNINRIKTKIETILNSIQLRCNSRWSCGLQQRELVFEGTWYIFSLKDDGHIGLVMEVSSIDDVDLGLHSGFTGVPQAFKFQSPFQRRDASAAMLSVHYVHLPVPHLRVMRMRTKLKLDRNSSIR
ncbi:hypothetical protein BDN70DRAFT_984047 [Pholiota conissans]|uniref:F-box domain-containing protein n=1 Tax=Pholiota conissans TaxID=109636 RepID=A0A9P6CTH7_9AGAR|nr:hypothetical protein BDN70DRAFT_984047 [Pholiota conissans]